MENWQGLPLLWPLSVVSQKCIPNSSISSKFGCSNNICCGFKIHDIFVLSWSGHRWEHSLEMKHVYGQMIVAKVAGSSCGKSHHQQCTSMTELSTKVLPWKCQQRIVCHLIKTDCMNLYMYMDATAVLFCSEGKWLIFLVHHLCLISSLSTMYYQREMARRICIFQHWANMASTLTQKQGNGNAAAILATLDSDFAMDNLVEGYALVFVWSNPKPFNLKWCASIALTNLWGPLEKDTSHIKNTGFISSHIWCNCSVEPYNIFLTIHYVVKFVA